LCAVASSSPTRRRCDEAEEEDKEEAADEAGEEEARATGEETEAVRLILRGMRRRVDTAHFLFSTGAMRPAVV
jgi:hypothetical protein